MNKNKATKTEKTPLQLYREAAPTSVAKFEIANIPPVQRRQTVEHAKHAAQLKYETNCHFEHKLQAYHNRKDVRALSKKLKRSLSEKYKQEQNEDTDKQEIAILSDEIGRVKKELSSIRKECELTASDVQSFTQANYKTYKGFQSIWSQIIARDVWEGIQKVLFGDGEHLNTREPDNFAYSILGGREIERGNIPKVIGDEIWINFAGLSGQIVVPDDDLYLNDVKKMLLQYLRSPETMKQFALDQFTKGIIVPTNRPKYVDIKVEDIRGRARIYALITYEGEPPERRDKDGNIRHYYGAGRVALDVNVSSHAAYNGSELVMGKLIEDSSRGEGFVERGMAREAELQRVMSNCVRENSDVGDDGNIIAGTFTPSRRYKDTARRLRDEKRRNAASKKYAAEEVANKLREMGNELVVEPNDPKKWKIKARNGGLGAGKNVQRYCPGMVQERAEYRFGCSGSVTELPKYDYRASQYDHVLGEYEKKKVSERLHFVGGDFPVSRDAYSVFLQYCCDDSMMINRLEAMLGFDRFVRAHDEMFLSQLERGWFTPNSGFEQLVWFRLMGGNMV